MSNKSMAIKGNVAYRGKAAGFGSKVIVGGFIFVAAFVLLAYALGHAEVAVNPLVPNRVL